tara:strand:+ start:634 stop:1878 length:1245 start_codon:yes stop_codon:yes gene_type:complete
MAYVVDIQFFNTFILRSATNNKVFVEESRIKGDFNSLPAGLGPKAYATNENYEENRRSNALIYSGIYNSRTDINKTNVFSAGEKITRAVDSANGSIQKLHAEDTNLNIFQEDKVSYALIDKDAIFTAEGGNLTASGAKVIGQIVPYSGKYGISKNPESFAVKGNRKYFADKNRGAILRLSRDGITEISQAGMRDFFKDNLKTADAIIGMYDDVSDSYVLNIKNISPSNPKNDTFKTLSFDEQSRGWVSFYSYNPDFGFSINKKFFTFKDNDIWKHYTEIDGKKNTFYDNYSESNITFIVNNSPSVVKNYNTINYEGSSGWEMASSITDLENRAFRILGDTNASPAGVIPIKFIKKENKYYAPLRAQAGIPGQNQIIGVDATGLKGFISTVKMSHNTSLQDVELFTVSHNIVRSS